MSGICGVLALDGGRPSEPEIEAIVARLARRGPDGSRIWHQGPAALGHTLLATTPEALVETLPLTEPESGCTITADCRLDNRQALIAELGLGAHSRVIGDGELILRSYLRWGEDCPKHLLGDFAFAIWDPLESRLFCARDHMGMRQLIYHHQPGKLFIFATEVEAVLTHPAVPRRINEGRIADFLDNLEAIDLTSTFFEHLHRLPPAHSAVVSNDGLSLKRYWQLEPQPRLKLESDEAYAEAFRTVFEESVRPRLRSCGPIGSMLSGGIDSNSVAATAAKLLTSEGRGSLATFSAVAPDPESCAETRAIRSAAAGPGFSPTFIDHSDLDEDADQLLGLAKHCSEPFDGHMSLVRAVYLSAHRAGINVMLDGVGGDVVLTAGNRVGQLLGKGRLLAALREARAERLFWGPAATPLQDFLASAWAAFAPGWLRRLRRRFAWRRADRKTAWGKERIAIAFARDVDIAERRARFRDHFGESGIRSPDSRLRSIVHPQLTVARERYDRVASSMAIEPRDPFLDIRVVEFALSLPPSRLQADGWPKVILRHAMKGLVPSDVTWRRGKEHLGWTFTRSVLDRMTDKSAAIERRNKLLADYVAPAALGRSPWNEIRDIDKEQQFELMVLSWWLDAHRATY